jgi:hypothetical protein
LLSGDERQSYRAGDTSLSDLLSGEEIRQLLHEKDVSLEVLEESEQ